MRYFLRLGALGLGGPVALCGQMEKELVQERRWVTREEMLEGIAVCQSLPGPLAIQVGIFISYLRGGFWGAWAGGGAFILPNFILVAALGALYVRAEVALLFLASGILGAVVHGSIRRKRRHGVLGATLMAPTPLAPAAVASAGPAAGSILTRLLLFFLKAGSLTFGSGLVIVPFLQNGLVRQTGWLDERQFLIAVAIGMISPGPVVITATFVGYLVAGFWGSVVATIGIFLPSFLLVLVAAPVLVRHRGNPHVQGFVKGAYAAAMGTILGARILLGRIAIGDWFTVLIALTSLGVLLPSKVSNVVLVAATALAGLIVFPILRPTLVLLK